MPNNHVNRVLRDSEVVSKRMLESKKEIEILKAEYERLLEQRLQAGTSNITDTDKQKEILSKREEKEVQGVVPVSSANSINTHRLSIKRKPSERLDSSRTVLEQGSPPKVRHYNPEDAREYIRKQRERRLQQQKQIKETDNALQLKKQKLKELHQKSLQIVARNRQRSKSRENHKIVEETAPPAPTVPPPLQVEPKPPLIDIKPLVKVATIPLKPQLVQSTSNITYRSDKTTSNEEVKYVKSSAKSDDAKIKAATLIQAYFRGHIQRKLYKDAQKQQNVITFDSRPLETKEDKVSEEKIPETIQEPKNKFPGWLQPEPTYNPYNFINSVKRKLNVALSTPVKTSDVGIQSSLSENLPVVTKTPQSYKEMREKIELSLSSKKSEQEINAKIERSLETIRNIQRREKEKEASTKHSIKGTNTDFIDLDVKRLEKLKLQSDHSDSDTSKNIPDISFESKCKSATSTSAVSVFSIPKDPPPKPKRLSRHDAHVSSKSSTCTTSEKFAKHAAEHLDEYKLNIDVEKLKQIKLQRRLKHAPGLENTMLQYDSTSIKTAQSSGQSNPKINKNTKISSNSEPESTKSYSIRTESQQNSSKHKKDSKSQQSDVLPGSTRRDSIISGNISRYTKSFDSYKSTPTQAKQMDVSHHEISEIPEDLSSFRQYMKEMDDTQKIMHTPFQPRVQAVSRLNPEKRLQEVITKVHQLDEAEKRDNSNKSTSDKPKLAVVDAPESVNIELVPPKVNLVLKCNDDNKNNKLSTKTSSVQLANGTTNQIHVKFEAELHMLNDFNESLKHIMSIEKSMLDLQTRSNLHPAAKETKDTQTSVITSAPTSKSNISNASIIEQSINFSRRSDFDEESIHNDDKVIVLHQNKNLMMDLNRSSSTMNISDITLNDTINSMNSLQSTQQAITSALNATDMDAATPRDSANQLHKLSSVGLSVGMFDQLIRDEDARIDNLKAVLKIREKTLLDRTKGELTWLEIQKKHLLETGKLHEASLLKKKQRGIILRLQEEKNEMQKLREAQKAASKERKIKLKEQCAAIKAQLSRPNVVTRIRRSSERRASGPVKVYQSEYYQSETSVSASDSVVYTSHKTSVLSHVAEDIPSRTEMAKRSLQMREAALQRRRKEAEDLLRWHQKLLKEERKIADLEMAASNVINQVPAARAAPIWNKESSVKSLDASISSKYSTDFDSDKENGAVEESAKQSESFNEIRQNINNITDEITELYKLSSMQKSALNDSVQTESSGSKSHTSKASIISKPKSVPEASVRVEATIDTESQQSFIRIQSKELSLHDVQLPEPAETEDDFSSIKSDLQNEVHSVVPSHDEASDASQTLKEQSNLSVKSKSDTEESKPEESLQEEEQFHTVDTQSLKISDEDLNLEESQSILEENVVEQSNNIELPSSKDISDDTEKISASEILIDVNTTIVEEDRSMLPSSKLDTTIDEPSVLSKNDLKLEPASESVDLDIENTEKEQISNIDEVDDVKEDSISSPIEESQVIVEKEDIQDVESVKSSESEVPEEVLPVIDVKIEEKKQDTSDVEVLESISKDSENTDFTEEIESVDESSAKKSTVDVKKRVSEILADANLNTSIEEKSPRLPDIYVTTYDVISPDNSPELGSPVDSSKSKPKDINAIGNEAQELLRKQLAIEQEIKQIERQQKQQLPYIFVREIPNKPPPPYTPPVQQPTSIVPTTAAEIEELSPHLAEIFHRGFVEKTLEYVTFPDTQLNQLENVDKVCAEFLFDISKEYAIKHYKQFFEPDEKAPTWMRLNKPKTFKRPHNQRSLELLLKKKLKQLFAFEKSDCKESMIIKWSRKKRDHVDELLVVESQSEEAEWTNYDQDELIVREEVTTGLLDMLIDETAVCLEEIFTKRQMS